MFYDSGIAVLRLIQKLAYLITILASRRDLTSRCLIFPAESIGNTTSTIPAFLDPDLKKEELLYGVSFASAASGYDDLTANLTVNDYSI